MESQRTVFPRQRGCQKSKAMDFHELRFTQIYNELVLKNPMNQLDLMKY
jgi:hypothetical protein